jgi:hypothetical protein
MEAAFYTGPHGGASPSKNKRQGATAELAFFVHNNMSFRLLSPALFRFCFHAQLLIQIYLIDYSFATSGPRLLARTTPSWQVTATSVLERLYSYKLVSVHPNTLKPTLTLPCTTPRPSPARGHITYRLSSVRIE